MTELRNVEADLSRFRMRVLVASIVVLVAFLLLVTRLVYLQVYRHEDLSEQAENNRTTIVPVVPNRGLILDRNGVIAPWYQGQNGNDCTVGHGCGPDVQPPFTAERFKVYHPGGKLGAALRTAGDLMHGGAELPLVGAGTPMRDALLVMTRAKAGSVAIVNARGRLVGVFTDGDFRRRMGSDAGLMERALSKVMTRSPVTVREDALAAEALRIFKERSIDDLIAVNARREPVGLVDLQDLPRLKLV